MSQQRTVDQLADAREPHGTAAATHSDLTVGARWKHYRAAVPDDELDPTPDPPRDPEAGDTQDVAPGAFAFFALEGDRFERPGLPADSTREVIAFRDAILAIAADLWRRDNPDRKNVPPRFAASFDLRLVDVRRGSVRPTLVLDSPAPGTSTAEWNSFVEYYRRAVDVATNDVQEVERDDDAALGLSQVRRRALSKVGKTLQSNERLRLGPPLPGPRAVVTPVVRQRLLAVDAPLAPPTTPTAVSVIGVLTEYDAERHSFFLRTDDDDRRVLCVIEHFNQPLIERVREHLALSYHSVVSPSVRVDGQTLQGTDEPVVHVYEVHQVEVVRTAAEKVMVRRLRELTSLSPGWAGPGSEVPTAELAQLLEPLASDLTSSPHKVHVVPTADGSIQLEWRVGDVEYTAELNTDRQLFLMTDNVVTDETASREMPFNPEALRRLLLNGEL